MAAAWEVPRNPLADATLDQSPLSNAIRRGYRIFVGTPVEAKRFAPGRISCSSCHLNAGQRERALPLVDIAGMFPEYNKRAGRLISLDDRIVDCFLRSENATGGADAALLRESEEVRSVSAYVTWLAQGSPAGKNPSWRNQNAIPAGALLPIDKLDPAKGGAIFRERCASCHGADGAGVAIGDKRAGPLWGADSWNDGAGAARVYTLAGIIRYTMPYLDPGSLSDSDAQQVAAFIDFKPRPAFPFKDGDYRVERLPPDSVYYQRR